MRRVRVKIGPDRYLYDEQGERVYLPRGPHQKRFLLPTGKVKPDLSAEERKELERRSWYTYGRIPAGEPGPAASSPSNEFVLHKLLLSLFSEPEFEHFCQQHPELSGLEGASLYEAALRLVQHEQVGAGLFQALLDVRPMRSADIADAAGRWGILLGEMA